jgi:hypothetical protein
VLRTPGADRKVSSDMATISDQPASQGAKVVQCCRCRTDIQPYAGRRVALLDRFAHQSGACSMPSSRPQVALQGALPFSWSCHRIEVGATEPTICDVAGSDPVEYSAHMRAAHGAHPLKPSTPKIKLRKTAPAVSQAALPVKPFKLVSWTETHHGEWSAEHGQPKWTTSHRGQFWAMGAEANSVFVVEDLRQSGRPNRIVTLWLDGSGSLTADWVLAKHSRHDANQRRAA